MSIIASIQWRLSEGRLHRLHVLPKRVPRLRALYLATDLYETLYESKPTNEETRRFANLDADLAQFVTSPTLGPRYLFRLAPVRDCVWEIRSVQPEPQIRVLGLFAAKDIFVATNFELRSVLGMDREAWRTAKRRAGAEWGRLFPGHDPRCETDIHQLVTGAINAKYFRNIRNP